MFEAASLKMEEEWTSREEYLCKEFQTVLSTELKGQHDKLSNQYEAELIQKDNATKAYEDSKNCQLANIEENYQRELEGMVHKMDIAAEEIWNDACEKFGVAVDDKISQSLAMADEHCSARDEQISMLLQERSELQKLLSEKESLLQDSVKELNNMEDAMEDTVSKMHHCHEKEVAILRLWTNEKCTSPGGIRK